MATVSPLAPASFPGDAADRRRAPRRPTPPASAIPGRNDLMVAELAPGSTVAGVFTQSHDAGRSR